MTNANATSARTSRTAVRRIATVLAASAVGAAALVGTPGTASAATSKAELRASVVKLTNAKRAAKGCKPLAVRSKLTTAAQRHSDDMARKNYFSHTSADGTSWDQRIREAGWKNPAGENIAYGFSTPKSVVKAWMNSPDHRRNILDCNFKYIGVGFTSSDGIWVQDFGY